METSILLEKLRKLRSLLKNERIVITFFGDGSGRVEDISDYKSLKILSHFSPRSPGVETVLDSLIQKATPTPPEKPTPPSVIAFVWRGEFRAPKNGEYYLLDGVRGVTTATADYEEESKRYIFHRA